MARLPYIDPQTATSEVRSVLARAPDLNIFRMVANASTLLEPFLVLGHAILYQTELRPQLREVAILRVAHLSGSKYEWVQHQDIGLAAGVPAEQIDAIARGETTGPAFSPEEVVALQLVTEVVETGSGSEATLQSLASLLPPRQVVEILVVIGYYLALARIALTTDIELDPPGWMTKRAAAEPAGAKG